VVLKASVVQHEFFIAMMHIVRAKRMICVDAIMVSYLCLFVLEQHIIL